MTLRANLTKFTLGQLAELLQKESEEDDEAVEQGLRLEVEGIDLGDRYTSMHSTHGFMSGFS